MRLPLPGRWVRRLVLHPVVWLMGVCVVTAAIPLLLVTLFLTSVARPGHGRILRLAAFGIVYLSLQVVGITIAFLTWLASGCGWAIRSPRFVELHYRVLRWLLGLLFWFGSRHFRLTVVGDGPELPGDDGDPRTVEHPLLVLSRHAGPGDSFLIVHELLSWAGRRPRIVLKDTLQLDPVIDLLFNRLPMGFVDTAARTQSHTLEEVAHLAATMESRDALLIFPEGGNVTPRRRQRAIRRLRDAGHVDAAMRAEAMVHLMPPRPAGVETALRANPGVQVVLVAHTGLDSLDSPADIWRELPYSKTLHLRWHVIPGNGVPVDRAGLSDWLFTQWEEMDDWVTVMQARPGAQHG